MAAPVGVLGEHRCTTSMPPRSGGAGTTPVAAGLTWRWRERTEVPWASSLREHNALSPNNLLYWTILKEAIAAGSRLSEPTQGPACGTAW
mgnify:CR=1 FL=1